MMIRVMHRYGGEKAVEKETGRTSEEVPCKSESCMIKRNSYVHMRARLF